jgi:hypothetical protein
MTTEDVMVALDVLQDDTAPELMAWAWAVLEAADLTRTPRVSLHGGASTSTAAMGKSMVSRSTSLAGDGPSPMPISWSGTTRSSKNLSASAMWTEEVCWSKSGSGRSYPRLILVTGAEP